MAQMATPALVRMSRSSWFEAGHVDDRVHHRDVRLADNRARLAARHGRHDHLGKADRQHRAHDGRGEVRAARPARRGDALDLTLVEERAHRGRGTLGHKLDQLAARQVRYRLAAPMLLDELALADADGLVLDVGPAHVDQDHVDTGAEDHAAQKEQLLQLRVAGSEDSHCCHDGVGAARKTA
jgi:hypothetical protein